MPYEIQVSHIREDYTISDQHSEVWKCTIHRGDELILLLNRVAIATTQFAVFEFPEVEIQSDKRRVYVRAISGKLYYTEHGSSHRKDLVVIPEEILRLLQGQSVEQALHHDPEDVYVRPDPGRWHGSRSIKYIFLAITLVMLAGSIYYCWRALNYQPRLVEPPRFVHMMENQGELLRKYADVYVSELREGATLFELCFTVRHSCVTEVNCPNWAKFCRAILYKKLLPDIHPYVQPSEADASGARIPIVHIIVYFLEASHAQHNRICRCITKFNVGTSFRRIVLRRIDPAVGAPDRAGQFPSVRHPVFHAQGKEACCGLRRRSAYSPAQMFQSPARRCGGHSQARQFLCCPSIS